MEKKIVKILSIDGGGIRGIIPAMIVAEIERRIGKPVSQLFDLIAGTSTGGILGVCLTAPKEDGSPKFSGKDMVELYKRDGPNIFSNTLWHRLRSAGAAIDAKYPAGGSEEVFQRHLGSLSLNQALTELLVPTYELEMGAPFFFKRHEALADPSKNFSLKQVVLSTIAAPTFFKPYVIESKDFTLLKHLVFIDGSVIANNPAMCAYVEGKRIFPDAKEYLVVSLGTGKYEASSLYDLTSGWGAAQWLTLLIRLFMSGSVDVIDHQMRSLIETSGDPLNHYYRLQVPLTGGMLPIDDTDEITMHKIEIIAQNLINDSDRVLDDLCARLTAPA